VPRACHGRKETLNVRGGVRKIPHALKASALRYTLRALMVMCAARMEVAVGCHPLDVTKQVAPPTRSALENPQCAIFAQRASASKCTTVQIMEMSVGKIMIPTEIGSHCLDV